MKRRNVLRELLNEDKPSIGTHLHTLWPGMVEVIGHSGAFDYIEFSGEYAPYDLFALENFGRAVDLFDNMTSMMKIDQEPRTYLGVRIVGSGIQNLLFADIRTPDDAREAVRASRAESPKAKIRGIAGVGMRRDVGYVYGSTDEYIEQLEDTVVALMIEKEPVMEKLEEVLSVGGIDMVQFGPSDYSMSIGVSEDHPKVKETERRVIETALKMGIAPRVELGDSSGAEPYIEMGVKHFCIGWDVDTIANWSREHGSALAKKLGK